MLYNDERNEQILELNDLHVQYTSGGQAVNAVNGVTVSLGRGKALGLVGETGAGKTTIARAIMQILPDHATRAVTGEILFKGKNLLAVSESELQRIRGKQISMVFQDPMTALNPVMTVGDQIAEGIQKHQHLDKAHAKKEAAKMLEVVGISADRMEEYPHQFSGGMKQRVVIAIALACNPELLIADEPTTALDVTIQAQVLDLIRKLRDSRGTTLVLITHDLGVVADICDEVAVIYAGEIVEIGALQEIYLNPLHPYTKGLFAAIPNLSVESKRLSPVPGLPPDPTKLPAGCYFAERCQYATDECRKNHCGLTYVEGTHYVRCLNRKEE